MIREERLAEIEKNLIHDMDRRPHFSQPDTQWLLQELRAADEKLAIAREALDQLIDGMDQFQNFHAAELMWERYWKARAALEKIS